jgi:GAF domain-containing protein
MMRRLITWFDRLSLGWRLLIGAISTAIPFYFAALLSHLVSESAKLNQPYRLSLHAAIFIVLLSSVVFISRYASTIRESAKREIEERRAALMHAYTFIDRVEIKQFENLHLNTNSQHNFVEAFVTYSTFEAAFGKSLGDEERIDFEVTFMTKSYIDGEITIPAYANREGRAPRSMLLKATKPDIYATTITSVIYREVRPSMHIIEDTSNREVDYQELYPEQKRRIRSSIVYPVLSDRNELLGTLVVHCDKANFFKRQHEKYWTDMLEIFAKRLAIAKARMDVLMNLRSNGTTQMLIDIPEFGF